MYRKLLILLLLITGICLHTFCRSSNYVFKENHEVCLPVLMYHSVLKDASRTGKYIITPQKFEEDLVFLEQKGYTTISASQLVKYVYNGSPLPEKSILITFDDGMYNNYKYIVPILKKHNANAVFSVVGSYTDEYTENNITNPAYSYMRWCDINELSGEKNVEFANHSYDFHSISSSRYGTKKNKHESTLDYISVFYLDTEKMQSEFYSNCNYKPFIYTYPFGSYSKESSRVLHKMGFLITFSCEEGINKINNNPECLYFMKRYNRDGRLSTSQFFSKLKI